MLDLMIADDHRRIAGCHPVGQIPGRNAGFAGINRHLQAIERIAGRVGYDGRGDARPPLERLRPAVERSAFASTDTVMVTRFPGLESSERTDDAFLADLHAAPDAPVLQIDVAHPRLRACDDAGRRAAQEFVTRIQHQIGSAGEKARQIVFGRCVDDDRDPACMGGFDEHLQRDLPILDDMVRHDIDSCSSALGDGA